MTDARTAVFSLENAETAVRSALDHIPDTWDDWEDTFTDAAYSYIENVRALLDAAEDKLFRTVEAAKAAKSEPPDDRDHQGGVQK
jgi:hypothetical protein